MYNTPGIDCGRCRWRVNLRRIETGTAHSRRLDFAIKIDYNTQKCFLGLQGEPLLPSEA
jgi:hypothetical protein